MDQEDEVRHPAVQGQGQLGQPVGTQGALVPTPKTPLRKFLEGVSEAFQGLKKSLRVTLRWFLRWFLPRLFVVFIALILFGGWIQVQPLKRAAGWLHPLERVNAYSWCISTNEGWPSVGQDYPAGPQAPSVRIAPGLWCNPRSPTRGVAGKMRILFPHLD